MDVNLSSRKTVLSTVKFMLNSYLPVFLRGSAAETACTATLRCGSGYTHFAGLGIRIRDRLDPGGMGCRRLDSDPFFRNGEVHQISIFFPISMKTNRRIFFAKVKVMANFEFGLMIVEKCGIITNIRMYVFKKR